MAKKLKKATLVSLSAAMNRSTDKFTTEEAKALINYWLKIHLKRFINYIPLETEPGLKSYVNKIENLIETGTLAASGITGRSGKKAAQAQMAALGRNQAVMTESMVSASRNTQANIRNINHELMEANQVAKSRRMFKPEYGPAPVKPLATPISDYEFPRELQDFDFGPKPIRGQKSTFTPSWGSVFANAAGAGLSAWNFGKTS